MGKSSNSARLILAAALAATLLPGARRAGAQCCGDCNGDDAVEIDEVIAAVGAALEGCRPSLEPRITLSNVELTTFIAALGTEVMGGRVSLTFEIPDNGLSARVLTIANFAESLANVSLFISGKSFGLSIGDASGIEHNASVMKEHWESGPHRVVIEWGGGTATMTLDGVRLVPIEIPALVLPAGSAFAVLPLEIPGFVLREIKFSARS